MSRVNPVFQAWLCELKADGLQLSAAHGAGAHENLWAISWPSSEHLVLSEIVEFLWSALKIRRELAALQSVRPVCFYAWHDEMAGQLRFSSACCTRATLPFGAQISLVDDPDPIAAEFIRSHYRDGIQNSELEQASFEEPSSSVSAFVLRVWAVELS